ncbi:MAG: hypothetical protein J5674_02785 [Candidatus Methanomethylophilaceae archaeon]|nr:hypothetical protein [Candidatus Methanomethylophilaceae archaeon]
MIWFVREDGAVARMDFPRFKKCDIKAAIIRDLRVRCMDEEALKGLVILPEGPEDAHYLRGHGDFSEWRWEHWRAAVMEQTVGQKVPDIETYATPEEAVDMARCVKAVAEGEERASRVWAVNDWEHPTVVMWDSRKIHGIPPDEWQAVHAEAKQGTLRRVDYDKDRFILISEAPLRRIVFGVKCKDGKMQGAISVFWEDYPERDLTIRGS